MYRNTKVLFLFIEYSNQCDVAMQKAIMLRTRFAGVNFPIPYKSIETGNKKDLALVRLLIQIVGCCYKTREVAAVIPLGKCSK